MSISRFLPFTNLCSDLCKACASVYKIRSSIHIPLSTKFPIRSHCLIASFIHLRFQGSKLKTLLVLTYRPLRYFYRFIVYRFYQFWAFKLQARSSESETLILRLGLLKKSHESVCPLDSTAYILYLLSQLNAINSFCSREFFLPFI